MGAAIVARVDASPVFDFAEHILDAMTLAIEGAVMRDRDLRLVFDGMHGVMPRSTRQRGEGK